MTLNAAAVIIPVALFLGWHGARFHRALKDVASAKDGAKKAQKILGLERTPFLIIGGTAFFVIWWWLHRHGG
jgi:hypothetical protein